MKQQYTHKELHELVWTTPLRTVATGLGISDVALAKTCRRADVPVPPRGYWARKHASLPVGRTPLPRRFPGASDHVGGGTRFSSWGPNWREQLLEEPVAPE